MKIETFQPPTITTVGGPKQHFEYDNEFKANFAGYVGKLSLSQMAYLCTGRKLPPDIDDYELFPVTAFNKGFNSTNVMGTHYEMPNHIMTNYRGEGGRIHGDSGLAIGLAFRGQAEAIAAGGLTPDLAVRINQIQAVGPKRSKEDKRDSGLHAGFLWRRTLINCWEKITSMAGFETVIIMSALNSTYAAVNGKDDSAFGFDRAPALHAYDDVAKAMHYTQAEPIGRARAGDWVKQL